MLPRRLTAWLVVSLRCIMRQFPNLPLVGKLNGPKPLPVYESRVDEAGNIEVLV